MSIKTDNTFVKEDSAPHVFNGHTTSINSHKLGNIKNPSTRRTLKDARRSDHYELFLRIFDPFYSNQNLTRYGVLLN